MSGIEKLAQFIANIIRFQKMKIFITLLSGLLFFVYLFPYQDFADFVTNYVSEKSQNQVFLQFEDLNIGLIPKPSVRLDEVLIETPTLPPLKAKSMKVSPSIASFLQFKAGANAQLGGFLEGDVDLTWKMGSKIESTGGEFAVYKQVIDIQANQIELSKFKEMFSLPMSANGKANLVAHATVDPSFREQPEGEARLDVGQLVIPAATITTAFGALPLPKFVFSSLAARARLVGSELIVEESQLGLPQDPVSARVKANLPITFRNSAAGIQPVLGSYDVRVELLVKNQGTEKLALFLSFIEKFKQPTNNGAKYSFRVRPQGGIPSIEGLAQFR